MSVITSLISKSLNLSNKNVDSTIKLLNEGATIPFISRYRKEVTGGLDEVEITNIKELNDKYIELEKRKEYIIKSVSEQDKLTTELENKIIECWDSTQLEDIYLPFKPKRQTRAEIARKKGLEDLAKWLMSQRRGSVETKATEFIKGDVADIDEAIKGARDIIAELVNEDAEARNKVRNIFTREAIITSKVVKGKEEEAEKYKDYFDFSSALAKCPSHRLLAIRRAEEEGLLRASISVDDERCLDQLVPMYAINDTEAADHVEDAVVDGYKRLLKPSI
ncbi:MAG TPA: RNA-binding transcriptional accessory protein, partial [Bacteroidales bacterium]|nr:RNA-binding transcriptional accessory protein [Bacteroidales bacterium]